MRKIETESGIFARTCDAPCTSISSSKSLPCENASCEVAARRAVVVAEDVGVLQKLAVADHLLEMLARGEVVFARILLRAAWPACGPGNRKLQSGDEGAQLIDEGRLPDPDGAEMMKSIPAKLPVPLRNVPLQALIQALL
jgi:hypothetical protein